MSKGVVALGLVGLSLVARLVLDEPRNRYEDVAFDAFRKAFTAYMQDIIEKERRAS